MLQQIKASAGSGKTYTLTRQFLTLLKAATEEQGGRACALSHVASADGDSGAGYCWPEILAVTFTNKAATEMRERIVRSLKERALDIEPQNPASDWSPDSAARWVNILLRHYSSLNVRTIDSLLNMLVRLSALELDLPPDFEPVFDERELFAPLYDAMLDTARAGGPERDLLRHACETMLHEEDREGFVPGESLRKRLYALMSRHMSNGPLPDTDDDALRGWLRNTHNAYTQTMQAMAQLLQTEGLKADARFLSYLAKALATSPFQAPVDSAYARKEHIDGCLNKASKGMASPDLVAAYADFRHLHEQLSGEGNLVRKALVLAPFIRLAAPLAERVHHMQQDAGKVPASLWPDYARQVLQGEAGASEAFCRMGTRLTHLLIDEFQDTSVPQWQAIQPLAVECLAKGGSLTYVGDVKQAIYGWRGGDSALFEAIPHDYELQAICPSPKRTPLPYNWRSCEEIVRFNNTIFGQMAHPDTARAFAAAMLPGAPDHLVDAMVEETVEAFTGAEQDVPAHKEGSGGYIRLHDIDGRNRDDLFDQVETQFTELFRDDLMPRRAPGDIAVLVRQNEEAALVAEWLVNLNIPVITENSLRLAEHPVIAQTVAFLQFLDYPPDDLSFWEFVSGRSLFADMAGLGDTELGDWLTLPREGSLFAAFRRTYPDAWRRWIAPFYTQAGFMSAYDTVRELFVRLDVFARFPQDAIFLRRFLEVAFAADSNGMRSLSSFLEYWKEHGGEEKVPMPENVDAVRIMTMHKAKGLEFPVTVIPFHHHLLLRGNEPELTSVLGQDVMVPRCKELGEAYHAAIAAEAREQLHLLYVAWTRPVEELHAFITTTNHYEKRSPTLVALRLLLNPFGMGADREMREPVVTIGTPPKSHRTPVRTAAAICAGTGSGRNGDDRNTAAPDTLSVPVNTEQTTVPGQGGWKPMQWLPRLKIFRNPLQEITYDERRRGTLVHGCLERLQLKQPDNAATIRQDVQRAIRHGMRAHPLPLPDRAATEAELADMLLWLAQLPDFAHWQHYGTPEQTVVDAHGAQHRTDLLVDDGSTLTVVEYKTGYPTEAHRTAHRQQVSRYINLLAAIPAHAQHALRSVLVYLDLQECVTTDYPRNELSSIQPDNSQGTPHDR